MVDEERVEEGAQNGSEVEASGQIDEPNREDVEPGPVDDRAELLRRAIFAEEALELSRYVQDSDLLHRLRGVISGQSEVELKQKLSVLKEVLAHIKESQGDSRPTQEGFEEIVASEVQRNLDRLNNAAEMVDAAVGRSTGGGALGAKDTAASRLRRLARMRGILIK